MVPETRKWYVFLDLTPFSPLYSSSYSRLCLFLRSLASQAVFSFPTKEEATRWMIEIDWRVQAHHRVYKFDDEVSSSEESASSREPSRRKRKEKTSKSKFSLTQKGRKK
jgi:hypothetical protein